MTRSRQTHWRRRPIQMACSRAASAISILDRSTASPGTGSSWRGSNSNCVGAACRSKTVVKPELDHAPVREGRGDLSEGGRIDILIPDDERRMIEDVASLHPELERVPFCEVSQLLNARVHIE